MKPSDLLTVFCFMPILLVYSLIELKRGWEILKHGKYSLNPTIRTRIWLLRHLRGDKMADEYRKNILADNQGMELRGFYSFAGGLIMLVGSVILILSWIL